MRGGSPAASQPGRTTRKSCSPTQGWGGAWGPLGVRPFIWVHLFYTPVCPQAAGGVIAEVCARSSPGLKAAPGWVPAAPRVPGAAR